MRLKRFISVAVRLAAIPLTACVRVAPGPAVAAEMGSGNGVGNTGASDPSGQELLPAWFVSDPLPQLDCPAGQGEFSLREAPHRVFLTDSGLGVAPGASMHPPQRLLELLGGLSAHAMPIADTTFFVETSEEWLASCDVVPGIYAAGRSDGRVSCVVADVRVCGMAAVPDGPVLACGVFRDAVAGDTKPFFSELRREDVWREVWRETLPLPVKCVGPGPAGSAIAVTQDGIWERTSGGTCRIVYGVTGIPAEDIPGRMTWNYAGANSVVGYRPGGAAKAGMCFAIGMRYGVLTIDREMRYSTYASRSLARQGESWLLPPESLDSLMRLKGIHPPFLRSRKVEARTASDPATGADGVD